MWSSNELGITRCRGCLDRKPRHELLEDEHCLKCREQYSSNYQPSDPEERHNFNKWKAEVRGRNNELKKPKPKKEVETKSGMPQSKKDDDYYVKLLSSEYDLPELGGYKTATTPIMKLVECVDCKKTLDELMIICSEKTDWKNVCGLCLIEREQQELKIEILSPKK